MTPSQYMRVTRNVDRLVARLSMEEATDASEVAEAVRAYVDQDYIDTVRKDWNGKTPVVDPVCHCLMQKRHHTSEHGVSDEWADKHYWVRERE